MADCTDQILGRCSPAAGSRHIDVRNVIWLGTSNIGHDLVFEFRPNLEEMMSREEYLELAGLLRPRVSERLGVSRYFRCYKILVKLVMQASLLSRVTAVLPFVPFSQDEKMAIATEAMYALVGDLVRTISPQVVESVVRKALSDYLPAEGARSLYRAVSSQLVDVI